MTEKEFIPYEQALALKELGFDEPCFRYNYLDISLFKCFIKNTKNKESDSILLVKNSELPSSNYTLPLYQQAFEFFRNNNIHAYIERRKSDHVWYVFNIYFERLANGENPPVLVGHTVNSWLGLNIEFETHREAELACIKYMIDILKNK